jgi:hypothetical protein
MIMQSVSKLLSGFSFIGHGNPNNNLESLCISQVQLTISPFYQRKKQSHSQKLFNRMSSHIRCTKDS